MPCSAAPAPTTPSCANRASSRSTSSSSISTRSPRPSRARNAATRTRSRTSTSAARRCCALPPRTMPASPCSWILRTMQARWRSCAEETSPRRPVAGLRRRHSATPRITTRWSPAGCGASRATPHSRMPWRRDSASSRTCATARTRTRSRRSIPIPWPRAHPWLQRVSCRARSSPTTTSPTRTRRSNACASSRNRPA